MNASPENQRFQHFALSGAATGAKNVRALALGGTAAACLAGVGRAILHPAGALALLRSMTAPLSSAIGMRRVYTNRRTGARGLTETQALGVESLHPSIDQWRAAQNRGTTEPEIQRPKPNGGGSPA